MDYIINPMWFYWLQFVDSIGFVFGFLAIMLSVVFVAGIIIWGICRLSYSEFPSISDGEHKTYLALQKMAIPFAIITFLSAVIWAIIPSRDTMISMMVAKYATYSNAQWTVDAVKSAVDYIVQAIQSIG